MTSKDRKQAKDTRQDREYKDNFVSDLRVHFFHFFFVMDKYIKNVIHSESVKL